MYHEAALRPQKRHFFSRGSNVRIEEQMSDPQNRGAERKLYSNQSNDQWQLYDFAMSGLMSKCQN